MGEPGKIKAQTLRTRQYLLPLIGGNELKRVISLVNKS